MDHNLEDEIPYNSGRTGNYLEMPAGSPDQNIFNLARSGLRFDLRAAHHKTINTGKAVGQRNAGSIGIFVTDHQPSLVLVWQE